MTYIYSLERLYINAKMAKMIQNITFTAFDNFIHYMYGILSLKLIEERIHILVAAILAFVFFQVDFGIIQNTNREF